MRVNKELEKKKGKKTKEVEDLVMQDNYKSTEYKNYGKILQKRE